MSKKLKAKREARGLSQDQAAALLGVDKETVSRWERGRNRPTGVEVIHKIKSEYGVTQQELDDWFLEWHTRPTDDEKKYRISGYEFLGQSGMCEHELLERLIDIDVAVLPDIVLQDEGTVEQWAPIFHASPFTWKVISTGADVVGYWNYVCLKDEYFEQVKNGTFRDAQLSLDMIEFPSFLRSEKNYKMYFLMMGIHGAHQSMITGSKLLKSFVREMEKSTLNGLFFSEFAAVAYTPQGIALCQDFGMRHLCSHPSNGNKGIAQVFHATGDRVSKGGHLSKSTIIANGYRERFG